jgi:hypothetical protein
MNALFPSWALGQNGFTTTPGPGSPGGTPGPGHTGPSPNQTQPRVFRPPFFEWPSAFYSPYDPYSPWSRYNAYWPYRPYVEVVPTRRLVAADGEARRLLDLAERADRIVERALSRADDRDATAGDRRAADEVRSCIADLTSAAGRFGRLLAELRSAVASGRPADLSLAEVRALETFAECARDAEDRR